eukprot:393222_1
MPQIRLSHCLYLLGVCYSQYTQLYLLQYSNYYPPSIYNDPSRCMGIYSSNCSFEALPRSCNCTNSTFWLELARGKCVQNGQQCSVLSQIYYQVLNYSNLLIGNNDYIYVVYLFTPPIPPSKSFLEIASDHFNTDIYKVLTVYTTFIIATSMESNGTYAYYSYLFPNNNCVFGSYYYIPTAFGTSNLNTFIQILPNNPKTVSNVNKYMFVDALSNDYQWIVTVYSCLNDGQYQIKSFISFNISYPFVIYEGYDTCSDRMSDQIFNHRIYTNNATRTTDGWVYQNTLHIFDNSVSAQIRKVEQYMSKVVNIGDSFIVLCLTFTNIIAATFIVIGLRLYYIKTKPKININFIINYILIILMTVVSSFGIYLGYLSCLSSTTMQIINPSNSFIILLIFPIIWIVLIYQDINMYKYPCLWIMYTILTISAVIWMLKKNMTQSQAVNTWTFIYVIISVLILLFWIFYGFIFFNIGKHIIACIMCTCTFPILIICYVSVDSSLSGESPFIYLSLA